MSKPRIFIGSSVEALPAMDAVRAHLEPEAEITVWSAGAYQPGISTADSLWEAGKQSDFAVFLIARDHGAERGAPRPRDNVMLELGFFWGALGRDRTLVVVDQATSLPSDLSGIFVVSANLQPETPDFQASVAKACFAIRRFIGERSPSVRPKKRFYSCFISYSARDDGFANRLHDSLQDVGIPCWFDAKDLRIGSDLTREVHRAVQAQDKLLVVLSQASVASRWVRQEVEVARRMEAEKSSTVLFPLRIDDAVLEASDPESKLIRERLIADFRGWTDQDTYRKAFSRLVRDLTFSVAAEASDAS